MTWRDKIPQLKAKVDSDGLTATQIENATDTEIKDFLNLTEEQFAAISPYLYRIKGHAAIYARRQADNAMWFSILAALSVGQIQWLGQQDSIELGERIANGD